VKIYAINLTTDHVVIDKHTDRRVIIDGFDDEGFPERTNTFTAYGYFEDDGADWSRTLDADSVLVVE